VQALAQRVIGQKSAIPFLQRDCSGLKIIATKDKEAAVIYHSDRYSNPLYKLSDPRLFLPKGTSRIAHRPFLPWAELAIGGSLGLPT